jgi:hypothetical protein
MRAITTRTNPSLPLSFTLWDHKNVIDVRSSVFIPHGSDLSGLAALPSRLFPPTVASFPNV